LGWPALHPLRPEAGFQRIESPGSNVLFDTLRAMAPLYIAISNPSKFGTSSIRFGSVL
jgi:hypothetical protein